jgi:hypothetical protein
MLRSMTWNNPPPFLDAGANIAIFKRKGWIKIENISICTEGRRPFLGHGPEMGVSKLEDRRDPILRYGRYLLMGIFPCLHRLGHTQILCSPFLRLKLSFSHVPRVAAVNSQRFVKREKRRFQAQKGMDKPCRSMKFHEFRWNSSRASKDESYSPGFMFEGWTSFMNMISKKNLTHSWINLKNPLWSCRNLGISWLQLRAAIFLKKDGHGRLCSSEERPGCNPKSVICCIHRIPLVNS